MKKLATLLLFAMSSTVYANCVITSSKDYSLTDLIEKEGWNFDNYAEVCQELKRHNLGAKISQVAYISNSQTTVSTSIRLYPLEIDKKYNKIILTASGKTSMLLNPERTTEMMNKLKYQDANDTLSVLTTDKELWKDVLDQIAFIRKYIK